MMNYGRGQFLGQGCFGLGFFSNGWNWLIGIGIVLILAAVIYLFIAGRRKSTTNDSALEALKQKFVQGEITEEEYKKRRSVLEGK